MSMRFNTEFNLSEKFKQLALQRYFHALIAFPTHQEWIDQRSKDMLDHPMYQKLTIQRKEYLRGYNEALFDLINQKHTASYYEWKGELYKDWDDTPEEFKEAVRKGTIDSAIHCHLYWKGTNKRW